MTEHGWHRALALLTFALPFAAWMIWSWASDPFDPAHGGTGAYGHNGEGAITLGLALLLIEVGAAVVAVAPWKRTGYVLTCAIFSVLLVPWTGLWALLSMHQGGVIIIHLMWLIALWLSMVGLTFVGLVRKLIARARRSPA